MKNNKQSFQYKNKVLIERAVFTPPYRHERAFQNEGCFLYIKGMTTRVLAADDKVAVKDKEAVLLRCNHYFLDFIKEADDQTVEVIAVHLFPEVLKEIYRNELPTLIEQQLAHKRTKHIASQEVISKFIDSLDFYFDNPALVNEDLLVLKIKELVLLLVQTKNVSSVLELIKTLYTPRIINLKQVIEIHRYSNLSVEELAKLCHLSVSSFKREFKKVFNDSPVNYMNAAKIKKSQDLLAISDMPIGEVAFEAGFNDPQYFARVFKKKVGVSPRTFRAQKTV